jgi:hypothetical protein
MKWSVVAIVVLRPPDRSIDRSIDRSSSSVCPSLQWNAQSSRRVWMRWPWTQITIFSHGTITTRENQTVVTRQKHTGAAVTRQKHTAAALTRHKHTGYKTQTHWCSTNKTQTHCCSINKTQTHCCSINKTQTHCCSTNKTQTHCLQDTNIGCVWLLASPWYLQLQSERTWNHHHTAQLEKVLELLDDSRFSSSSWSTSELSGVMCWIPSQHLNASEATSGYE